MTKPSDFTMSSDYGLLKADSSSQTLSVLIPGGITIPNGGVFQVTSEREVGGAGSSFRSRVSSTKNINDLIATVRTFSRSGSLSGSATTYSLQSWASRVGPTTVRVTALIENNFGVPLTTEAGNETIRYVITTYKSPFS